MLTPEATADITEVRVAHHFTMSDPETEDEVDGVNARKSFIYPGSAINATQMFELYAAPGDALTLTFVGKGVRTDVSFAYPDIAEGETVTLAELEHSQNAPCQALGDAMDMSLASLSRAGQGAQLSIPAGAISDVRAETLYVVHHALGLRAGAPIALEGPTVVTLPELPMSALLQGQVVTVELHDDEGNVVAFSDFKASAAALLALQAEGGEESLALVDLELAACEADVPAAPDSAQSCGPWAEAFIGEVYSAAPSEPVSADAAFIAATANFQPLFPDVRGHWAETEIRSLSQQGIIAGFEDGSFRPNAAITRAQFAAMLNKAFLEGFPVSGGQTFPDVPATHWAREAIRRASAAGFMRGYDDGRFRPDQTLTQVEAAVALANGLDLDAGDWNVTARNFAADSQQVPEWARASIANAEAFGLFSNPAFHNGRLRPNDTAPRGLVASYIYHASTLHLTCEHSESCQLGDPRNKEAITLFGVAVYLTAAWLAAVTLAYINPANRPPSFPAMRRAVTQVIQRIQNSAREVARFVRASIYFSSGDLGGAYGELPEGVHEDVATFAIPNAIRAFQALGERRPNPPRPYTEMHFNLNTYVNSNNSPWQFGGQHNSLVACTDSLFAKFMAFRITFGVCIKTPDRNM